MLKWVAVYTWTAIDTHWYCQCVQYMYIEYMASNIYVWETLLQQRCICDTPLSANNISQGIYVSASNLFKIYIKYQLNLRTWSLVCQCGVFFFIWISIRHNWGSTWRAACASLSNESLLAPKICNQAFWHINWIPLFHHFFCVHSQQNCDNVKKEKD